MCQEWFCGNVATFFGEYSGRRSLCLQNPTVRSQRIPPPGKSLQSTSMALRWHIIHTGTAPLTARAEVRPLGGRLARGEQVGQEGRCHRAVLFRAAAAGARGRHRAGGHQRHQARPRPAGQAEAKPSKDDGASGERLQEGIQITVSSPRDVSPGIYSRGSLSPVVCWAVCAGSGPVRRK